MMGDNAAIISSLHCHCFAFASKMLYHCRFTTAHHGDAAGIEFIGLCQMEKITLSVVGLHHVMVNTAGPTEVQSQYVGAVA
jgi:hypothetical protein